MSGYYYYYYYYYYKGLLNSHQGNPPCYNSLFERQNQDRNGHPLLEQVNHTCAFLCALPRHKLECTPSTRSMNPSYH